MTLRAGTTVRIKELHRDKVDHDLVARYRSSIGRIGTVAASARGMSGREIVGVTFSGDARNGDFLLFYRDEVEPVVGALGTGNGSRTAEAGAALSA